MNVLNFSLVLTNIPAFHFLYRLAGLWVVGFEFVLLGVVLFSGIYLIDFCSA